MSSVYVQEGQFPNWPCLYIHSRSIAAALDNGDLQHGRDGKRADDHVAPERRTIAHADLREWVRKEYPADVSKTHMAWLFDDVERTAMQGSIPTEKALSAKERNNLLRIIRALDVMAKLPERGAATSIVTMLQKLGFNSPGDDTTRNLIGEARAMEPD